MRLARSIGDEAAAGNLRVLAADYLERAEVLAQGRIARPEPLPQQMQQQQQRVPDPDERE